jgi:hypothetical protein
MDQIETKLNAVYFNIFLTADGFYNYDGIRCLMVWQSRGQSKGRFQNGKWIKMATEIRKTSATSKFLRKNKRKYSLIKYIWIYNKLYYCSSTQWRLVL